MGIIGVVAALTLPNLNSSTGDKEKVAKLKKVYANLNDAIGRAIAVYGPIETWPPLSDDASGTTRFYERISEFLKISKDCGNADSSKICWNEDLSKHQTYRSFILADGTGVFLYANILCSEPNTELKSGEYTCGVMMFDIDGANKGKNTLKYDIFDFLITKDGIIPRG